MENLILHQAICNEYSQASNNPYYKMIFCRAEAWYKLFKDSRGQPNSLLLPVIKKDLEKFLSLEPTNQEAQHLLNLVEKI